MNPDNSAGEVLHLSGKIKKDDGKTPMRNCLIEIWQCGKDGFYDNISDQFLYRASQKTDKNGFYEFMTSIPVPEPTDETLAVFRPAHIHMRISAKGQQDLITQINFYGDPHLESDPSTKSESAAKRILKANKISDNKSYIQFDITQKNNTCLKAMFFIR